MIYFIELANIMPHRFYFPRIEIEQKNPTRDFLHGIEVESKRVLQ